MEKAASDVLHDYWEAIVESDYNRVYYYFRLDDGSDTLLYYGNVFTDHLVDDRSQYFKLPFNHRADLAVELDWVKDAVVYNISALLPPAASSAVRALRCHMGIIPSGADWAGPWGELPRISTICWSLESTACT